MNETKGDYLATDSGEFDIEAHILQLGDDILVAVWGGDTPHIGAVAMSQSRPSLADPDQRSATASIFNFLGHKEGDLAKQLSESLSKQLDRKIVVAMGIHWDQLSEEGISKIIENCERLKHQILDHLDGLPG